MRICFALVEQTISFFCLLSFFRLLGGGGGHPRFYFLIVKLAVNENKQFRFRSVCRMNLCKHMGHEIQAFLTRIFNFMTMKSPTPKPVAQMEIYMKLIGFRHFSCIFNVMSNSGYNYLNNIS